MYLIFSTYIPLPESPYHRVLYVWACNKRSCMRKQGSYKVIRSHMVDQAYLKSQRQKEEEKRKREEKKKAAIAAQQKANQGFQLGDLWGNSATGFGTSASSGTGFGMKKAENTGFGFGSTNGNNTGFGFGSTATTSGGFGSTTKTAASVVAAGLPPKEDTTLIDKMNSLGLENEPKLDINTLPKFPGQYLYIDEEKTDSYESMGIDMSRYKEYLDMEKDLLMEIDEGSGETWQGEQYEKQHLPKGVDKQFKKFTERVEFNPTQCVRFDFSGQPLFYSSLYPQQQQELTKKCQYCSGTKVFEFQLMPNVLSVLPTSEYASASASASAASSAATTQAGKAKNIDAKTMLDSWSVGMEFGTVLVFTCQKDCHPGSIEDICYMEETIIVQYETD
jgi:pre-rRNA-processing protein TSR4